MRPSLSLPPVNEGVTQKCIDETWSEYVLVIVWLMTWGMVNVFTFSQVQLDKSGSVVRGAQSRYRLSVEGAIHLWDNQNLCPNYDPQRRPHKNVRIWNSLLRQSSFSKKRFSSLCLKMPLYQHFCPHFTGVDDFVVPEVQLFSLGRKKLYFFLVLTYVCIN